MFVGAAGNAVVNEGIILPTPSTLLSPIGYIINLYNLPRVNPVIV
jgi:hypothetical protein